MRSTSAPISATATTRTPLPCESSTSQCCRVHPLTSLSYDVSDKKNSKIISRTTYEGATFTHQGWVNDLQWQEWLFMDDEYDEDELAGPAADGYPVTYIWDIRDLENPKQTGLFKAVNRGIDHNLYVVGDHIYQSNYG